MPGGIPDDAIRERAYRIWLDEGRPHGRHDDHWLRAKSELESESGGGTKTVGRQSPRRRRAPAAKRGASKSRSDTL